MRQVDLVVATGSQTNVRAAYSSGTPAIGVGAGNVAVIVDETADLADAADKIARSKMLRQRDELLVGEQRHRAGRRARAAARGARRRRRRAARRGRSAPARAGDVRRAEASHRTSSRRMRRRSRGARACRALRSRRRRFLIVEESGVGRRASVLRRKALAGARALSRGRLCRCQGARRAPVAASGRRSFDRTAHARLTSAPWSSASTLPVCRVIVNQAHCFATGGSFDNALPFSLSMGCGTWGRNSISDNLNYRHFLNITRVVRPLPPERVRRAERRRAVRSVSREVRPETLDVTLAAWTHASATRSTRTPRASPTHLSCSRPKPTRS